MNKGIVFACGSLIAALVAGCAMFGNEGPTWRTAESPLINAHRGSRFEFDDNAAEGFAASLAAGVRGFETDIRITKDDELVIMHDKDVSRTTTGKGDVHDMTAAEVTALTLKKSGSKVPTARRLMETFRGVKGIRIEFEMKESTRALGAVRGETYCRKLHDLAAEIMEPGTYVFTSFAFDTLETMKLLFPDAPIGAIFGKPLTRELVDKAAAIGCIGVAPLLNGTTRDAIDYAHAKGLVTTPWMIQTYRDYAKAYALGSDTGTSDFAMGLLAKVRTKRRLVCLDLDATLCQHRSPIPPENLAALRELMKRYKCIMVGAGNAPRIHRQMEGFPIDIIGGSTSFDFAGKEYNKYDAILSYARRHGYALDEIVFVGDDFGDGGGDSHVRLKGMDYIEVEDFRDFPRAVSILMKAEPTDEPGRVSDIAIVSPAEGSTVPLLNAAQKAYLGKSRAERVATLADEKARKTLRDEAGHVPAKVRLAWACRVPGVADVRYAVKVVNAANRRTVFETETKKTSVEIDNLEIAARYEWTVSAVTRGGREMSGRGTFFTEDLAPRLIRLDGVPNVRDLGGRRGLGGKRVRQGMVYRSSGLNHNAGKYYTKEQILEMYKAGTLLTAVPERSREAAKSIKGHLDKGQPEKADFRHLVREWVPGRGRLNDRTRAYVRATFGIKTDIDLRTDRECYGMTGSPLGPDVRWIQISSSAYGGMMSGWGKEAFAKVFKLFLDRSNYPIDFHCIAGADRTGAVGYILGALLGHSDEDLWKDWETTAFSNSTSTFNHAARFDHLVAAFDKLPGKTTREKVEGYVKSLGFTKDDIDTFRGIMLEK